MWSDPGTPKPPVDPLMVLRGFLWAAGGAVSGGAVGVYLAFAGDKLPAGTDLPVTGAALFGLTYTAWATWRRRR